MTPPWRCMTSGDWIVTSVLITLALAGITGIAHTPGAGRVQVTDGERVLFTAPLDVPRSIELSGPLGKSRLEIDGNGARITAAPCPRKVCMTMGPIRHVGELIACIPNHILVSIEAPKREENRLDLISR